MLARCTLAKRRMQGRSDGHIRIWQCFSKVFFVHTELMRVACAWARGLHAYGRSSVYPGALPPNAFPTCHVHSHAAQRDDGT